MEVWFVWVRAHRKRPHESEGSTRVRAISGKAPVSIPVATIFTTKVLRDDPHMHFVSKGTAGGSSMRAGGGSPLGVHSGVQLCGSPLDRWTTARISLRAAAGYVKLWSDLQES